MENYALHIAEEDGQVDWDFQALNNRDVIEKFGFNILALVEKKNVPEVSKDIVVTLWVEEFSTVFFPFCLCFFSLISVLQIIWK